jgi:hypothetical protein
VKGGSITRPGIPVMLNPEHSNYVGHHEIHRDVSMLELLCARIRNADSTYDSRRVTVEFARKAAIARENRLNSMVTVRFSAFSGKPICKATGDVVEELLCFGRCSGSTKKSEGFVPDAAWHDLSGRGKRFAHLRTSGDDWGRSQRVAPRPPAVPPPQTMQTIPEGTTAAVMPGMMNRLREKEEPPAPAAGVTPEREDLDPVGEKVISALEDGAPGGKTVSCGGPSASCEQDEPCMVVNFCQASASSGRSPRLKVVRDQGGSISELQGDKMVQRARRLRKQGGRDSLSEALNLLLRYHSR